MLKQFVKDKFTCLAAYMVLIQEELVGVKRGKRKYPVRVLEHRGSRLLKYTLSSG